MKFKVYHRKPGMDLDDGLEQINDDNRLVAMSCRTTVDLGSRFTFIILGCLPFYNPLMLPRMRVA